MNTTKSWALTVANFVPRPAFFFLFIFHRPMKKVGLGTRLPTPSSNLKISVHQIAEAIPLKCNKINNQQLLPELISRDQHKTASTY